jgi:uncharacterized protein YeaC (DUF1315 family)
MQSMVEYHVAQGNLNAKHADQLIQKFGLELNGALQSNQLTEEQRRDTIQMVIAQNQHALEERGLSVTARGQDIASQTAQRGQDITARTQQNQDLMAGYTALLQKQEADARLAEQSKEFGATQAQQSQEFGQTLAEKQAEFRGVPGSEAAQANAALALGATKGGSTSNTSRPSTAPSEPSYDDAMAAFLARQQAASKGPQPGAGFAGLLNRPPGM